MSPEYQTYYVKKKKPNRTGRIVGIVAIVIVLLGLAAVWCIWGPNTGNMQQGEYLYIPTGSNYDYVKQELEDGGYTGSTLTFDLLARQADYPNRVKAGKYRITPGMSNYAIVKKLRSGSQEPVKLVINKLRTKEEFIKFISDRMEPDSLELAELLQADSYLAKYGLDRNTAMAVVIPDTYEFYWNTSADKIFQRLAGYYEKFWTEERKRKAGEKKLSPLQVITVASIVEEETNKNKEKPNVASVYLNRLNKGMKLQADPTIKFAMNNFALRRITGEYLNYESPYNTYKYAGLPPGPIATPSKASIDAVLNAPATDYIYFCAREDFSGYHNFASNYAEHMNNARKYQQALNARGIR